MSRQFNSTTIPEGSVPPDPKRTGRVPRLTRKRKSEVLDAVEKTPETPVTQQTPPPPANTNTIHPITNALKKVRKETSEPPTPNTSPTASSSTTSTQGRTRRGLQDRKSGGEKDLIEETTSTPEVPEIEFKTEEGTPSSSRGRGKGRVSNEEGISSSLNNSNNSPVSGSGRRGRGKVEGEKEGTSEPEAGSRQRRNSASYRRHLPQSEPKRSQRISNSRDGSLDSSSTVKKGKQKTIPEMLKRQESVPMTKAYPSRGGKKEDSDIGFTKTVSEEIDVESIDSSSQDVPSEQLSYQGQDGMEDALSETADNDIEMENVETPEADGEADDLEDLNPEEALVNPVHSEVEDIPADEELSDDIDVENIDEDFVDKDKIDEDVDNESHEDNIKSSEICEKVDEGKEATDSTNEESSLKLAVVDNSAEPTVLKNSDETISGVSKDATPINISTEEIKKITTSIEGGDAGMALNEELVKEVLVDNESSSAEGLDKEVKLSEITEVKVTMADSEPDGHVTSKPTEEIVLEENKDTPAGDTLSYASHYSSNLLNDTDCPVAELEHSATPGTEDMLPEESATVAIGEKALEENPTQQSNDESQSVSGENVPIMANEAGSVAVPSEMGITPSQEVILKLNPLGEGVRKSKRLSRNSSPTSLAIAAPRSPEDAGKNQSKPIGTQSAYVVSKHS
ncbi:retinitis pigmentosa 1-like 1 protein [Homarus americanus]|uniref:retinitis pigmentosa 1-like 1 protein n=1 Tax=Homarus americanus TaxID=6706 RepID=UPI001C47DE9F|nr:retinitis pigmentosa 1-like 1 protein [Homarus americanus]